jgi:hypothetical protein
LVFKGIQKKKDVPLEACVGVTLGGVSFVGTGKLFAVTFSDALATVPRNPVTSRWFTLAPDDALYLFVGALALAWVSVQRIRTGYKTVAA